MHRGCSSWLVAFSGQTTGGHVITVGILLVMLPDAMSNNLSSEWQKQALLCNFDRVAPKDHVDAIAAVS